MDPTGPDGGGRVELAPEAPAGAAPLRPPKRDRVDRRGQFSLLIVRGDGARVVRFNFARPTAVSTGVALAVMISLTVVLLGDWAHMRRMYRDAASLHQQIADQDRTIESFNTRAADLRKEIAGWRELHARIWEPFGPELAAGGKDRGIGGGTPTREARPPALSPADQLNGLTEDVQEHTQRLTALERLMARAGKAVAALPSRWPVRGAVNSEYGKRRSPWSSDIEFHSGLDIRAERGTPIQAPASGTVVLAGNHQDYGTAIILDHGQEIRSLYGHLSRLNVQPGQRVERGGIIGWTGNTGRSSGPHLHYEIYVRGQAVNPRAYLWD